MGISIRWQHAIHTRFLELDAYVRNRRKIYEIAKLEVERRADGMERLTNLLIEAYLGTSVPIPCTALGKYVLAHFRGPASSRSWTSAPEPMTSSTVTNTGEPVAQLDRVRDGGWTFDDEERIGTPACSCPDPQY